MVNEKCYYDVGPDSVTYFEAKEKCESMKSKLPEPIDLTEVKAIYEATNKKSIWIGINDIEQENMYIFSLYILIVVCILIIISVGGMQMMTQM